MSSDLFITEFDRQNSLGAGGFGGRSKRNFTAAFS
jgi:hypothetical protein